MKRNFSFCRGVFLRNLGIGLVLGLASLMLVPIYAEAIMSLNNVQGSAGHSVGSIEANQGDTISFVVTSTISNPTIQMITDPENGVTQFPTVGAASNNTFTWNTGGNPSVTPGPYVAVFEATSGTQVEYLIVMIRINPAGSGTQYPLTINVNPAGAGTFSGAGSYNAGATATVTASASAGYAFSSWTEGTSPVGTAPTSPTNVITMNASHTITANFVPSQQQQFSLSITANPAGAGTFSGAGSYNAGATATVSATANAGYVFSSWTEGTSPVGTYPSATTNYITMNSAHTITANFTSSTPPPGSCTSGIDMSADVGRAQRLTQSITASGGGPTGFYGYENGGIYPGAQLYPLPAGQTVVFLADPKGFGVEPTPVPARIGFMVADYSQGSAGGELNVQVKRIDQSNCFIKNVGVQEDHNWFWPGDYGYASGNKLLFYVSASSSVSISLKWSVY